MTKHKLFHGLRLALLGALTIFCFGAAGEICGSFFDTAVVSFSSSFPDNKPEDVKEALPRDEALPGQAAELLDRRAGLLLGSPPGQGKLRILLAAGKGVHLGRESEELARDVNVGQGA